MWHPSPLHQYYSSWLLILVLTVSDNVTVYPGEAATFYCNGSSAETLGSTYQWEKVELNGNKDVISSDDDMDSSGSIYDYSNILTINNINFTDNGVGFYCRTVDFSNSDVAYINGKLYIIVYHY